MHVILVKILGWSVAVANQDDALGKEVGKKLLENQGVGDVCDPRQRK